MRRSPLCLFLAIIALLALAAGGCASDDPLDDHPLNRNDDHKNDKDCHDDECDEDEGLEKVSAPSLDDPEDDETCKTKIGLRGHTHPDMHVRVLGGRGSGNVGKSNEQGEFCVRVSLQEGETNELRVEAFDETRVSEPSRTVEIEQHGNCDEDKEIEKERDNIEVRLLDASQVHSIDHGSLGGGYEVRGKPDRMVDGKESTVTEFQTEYLELGDANIWIWFQLRTEVDLKRVEVIFGDSENDGERGAKEFELLRAEEPDPGDPALSNTEHWIPVASETTNKKLEWETEEINKEARHVALWLKHDTDNYSWTELYEIAEVRFHVYEKPPPSTRRSEDVCE
jgi:hypothetical protein